MQLRREQNMQNKQNRNVKIERTLTLKAKWVIRTKQKLTKKLKKDKSSSWICEEEFAATADVDYRPFETSIPTVQNLHLRKNKILSLVVDLGICVKNFVCQ